MFPRANSGVVERDRVLEMLQSVAPSLYDEVFLVTCMFEDTRVTAALVSFAGASAAPPVEAGAPDASSSPVDAADFGANFELAVAVPIHAVSVAGGTLNTVYLVMSVAAPLADDAADAEVAPPPGCPHAADMARTARRSAFRVVVKSPLLALSVRQDLAAQLEDLRATVGDDGATITMAALALRMQDLVAGLSVQAQATHFGCCLDCNSKQFKAALRAASSATAAGAAAAGEAASEGPTTNATAAVSVRKSLQPLHIEFDAASSPYGSSCDGGVMAPRDTVSEYRLAMMTDEERAAQMRRTAYCLTCNSTNIIHVPCARPGGGRLCSYCMYEESPLLEFDCGCRSCFDCFERYAEMAVGRRQVRQRAHGGPQWGIGCAVHPTTVVWDVGLMKLLDSRTLMRFQAFALNAAVNAAGGFTCANSQCRSGIPQFPTRGGQLVACVYCCRGTCPQCQRSAVDCECLRLSLGTTREMKEIVSRARNDCARVPRNCPATTAAIMLAVGKERMVIPDLDLNGLQWAVELHNAAAPFLPQNSASSGVGLFVFYFLGAPLSPMHPLWCAGVHPGAVIFAVPVWELHPGVVAAEVDLWEFRRGSAKASAVMDDLEGTATSPADGAPADGTGAPAAEGAVPLKNRVIGSRKAAVAAAAAAKARSNGLFRRCPKCKAPVIHYWGHGCHHIGVVACCGYQWCFLCLDQYPCKQKCPLFCTRTCGCAPCPECKPLMPCAHCQGCPNCSADFDASVFR